MSNNLAHIQKRNKQNSEIVGFNKSHTFTIDTPQYEQTHSSQLAWLSESVMCVSCCNIRI